MGPRCARRRRGRLRRHRRGLTARSFPLFALSRGGSVRAVAPGPETISPEVDGRDGTGEGESQSGNILASSELRYVNRELSWLDFNRRVLALAASPTQPLLERAKFLAIFSTNLDEFFQVRVAGLKDQLAAGINEVVVPELATHGPRLVPWSSLGPSDKAYTESVFESQMFPVLTPLGVDPGHPFPYISNLSLNLVVEVQDPSTGERRIARVKVPPVLPRFVVMHDSAT